MTLLEMALIGLCILLVVLPPKWDPAIRLKEYTERLRKRREDHE